LKSYSWKISFHQRTFALGHLVGLTLCFGSNRKSL